MKKTEFGRSLYSIGGSPQSALLMGINVQSVFSGAGLSAATMLCILYTYGAARRARASQRRKAPADLPPLRAL
jgi:ribose/xylose/arabinose/galactoside ABC-type transport system permease subunit